MLAPIRRAALLAALLLAGFPALAACPALPAPGFALPSARGAAMDGRPLTIIAFGSSSTEGFGASGPQATYPARLQARLRAALPGQRITVLNRGKGGEEVTEMLARLRQDVVDAAPTLVIWQAGTNAALRRMDPAAFRAGMEAGLDQFRAAGIEVLLMDSQVAPRVNAAPGHRRYDAILARLAADRHLPIFSRGTLMHAWEQAGLANGAVIGPDGLHHTDLGYDCVAGALADGIIAALRPPATARR
ncbi:MAG TPA: SGNH/GDSL hydrolase family protein [Roseomonas sp.]|jgi:lysophospholipase L1-like esterase